MSWCSSSGDRRVSYADLDRLTTATPTCSDSCGLAAGDRVVVALDNGADMVAAYLGAMSAGGVAVPLPHGPRSDRLAVAIADCRRRSSSSMRRRPVRTDRAACSTAWRICSSLAAQAALPPPFVSLGDAVSRAADGPIESAGHDTDLAAIIYTSG